MLQSPHLVRKGCSKVIAAIVPVIVGALLAAAVSLGLVYEQNKAPSTNPANPPILAYGQPPS